MGNSKLLLTGSRPKEPERVGEYVPFQRALRSIQWLDKCSQGKKTDEK